MTKSKCPGPANPQDAARLILQVLVSMSNDLFELKELYRATTQNEQEIEPPKLHKGRRARQ